MRARNLQIAFLSLAIAIGWSGSSTGASESPYSLTINFLGWTNAFGATAAVQAKFAKLNGPHIEAPNGDWAILAITNHGTQYLRFDSVAAEYEAGPERWIEVKPKQWPGLHGSSWMPGTGSIVYLLCPNEVPHKARWRVRYTSDVDRQPSKSPLVRAGFEVVHPILRVSPALPPADPKPAGATPSNDPPKQKE